MSTTKSNVYISDFSGKLSPVMTHPEDNSENPAQGKQSTAVPAPALAPLPTACRELGGREGPEPTRFGDWELRGRCIDF
jgi:hypothetical protein